MRENLSEIPNLSSDSELLPISQIIESIGVARNIAIH